MRVDQEEIRFIQGKLLKWFDVNGRSFPWRKKSLSQYQVIISEVLLQRTKAETVAKFYPAFIKTYPNWVSLEKAGIEEIGVFLKPVGLYRQRSKRLHDLAKEMVKRKGKLPRERQELEQIPFLGQYIANAIELQIFKQPSPLLDVNMARVLERYFGERKMADIRYDPYLQDLAKRFVDHTRTKELNWAILDFAALVCKANKPLCNICPLKSKCLYFRINKNL